MTSILPNPMVNFQFTGTLPTVWSLHPSWSIFFTFLNKKTHLCFPVNTLTHISFLFSSVSLLKFLFIVFIWGRENLHPLIHSANAYNSWGGVRLKLGVWNSIWVSHGQYICSILELEINLGVEPGALTWDDGIPGTVTPTPGFFLRPLIVWVLQGPTLDFLICLHSLVSWFQILVGI